MTAHAHTAGIAGFVGNCATGHGNRKPDRGEADDCSRIVLDGARRDDDPSAVTMPGFGLLLNDAENAMSADDRVERVGGTAGNLTLEQVASRRSEPEPP